MFRTLRNADILISELLEVSDCKNILNSTINEVLSNLLKDDMIDEVITEYTEILFERCLPMNVSLQFESRKVEPGQGRGYSYPQSFGILKASQIFFRLLLAF